ncbi:MAG TPA: hypothetical protein VGN59_11030 [Acidimicrobiia bacterium]|jgi:hypothetical protein
MNVVEVGLAPSLGRRRKALQELLGSGYAVADGIAGSSGVVVLDEATAPRVHATRVRAHDLGIIVLLDDQHDCTPRAVVALIDDGADVCLVAPGVAGLAAHVRALAAHHPARPPASFAPSPCPA